MRKILILSMKTWGELGNYLAGELLANTFKNIDSSLNVKVHAADDIIETLATIGKEIKEIMLTAANAEDVFLRYNNLFSSYEANLYSADFEHDVTNRRCKLDEEINVLREFIAAYNPDIVIGTKGIISRLVFAANNQGSKRFKLINYITNHGLLDLAIHRSSEIMINIVQFEDAKNYILSNYNYSTERVLVTGRISSRPYLTNALNGDFLPRIMNNNLSIILFANRISECALLVANRLVGYSEKVNLYVICQGDEKLEKELKNLIQSHNINNWIIYGNLIQNDYFKLVSSLKFSKHSLLISKTGPNTMLEAIQYEIPVLLLNSGLPMEQWVAAFIKDNYLGFVEPNITCLLIRLNFILENLFELENFQKASQRVSHIFTDEKVVHSRLRDLITD